MRIDKTSRVANGGRYRLLADGEVIDKTTGRLVGFIDGKEIDDIFTLRAQQKQKYIREKFNLPL